MSYGGVLMADHQARQ